MKPVLIGLSMDAGKNEKGQPYFWIKENYCQAILQAGGIPVPLPYHTEKKRLREHMKSLGGLVITGGNFDIHPRHFGKTITKKERNINEPRTDFEIDLLQIAYREKMPVLGVCGGMQLINVFLGGSLFAHVDHHEGGLHVLDVARPSALFKILKSASMSVNTSHHQAVDRVGRGLTVSARSKKDGVIEAVEMPNPFWLGVQWHPEAMLKTHPKQSGVYAALVKRAAVFGNGR